MHKNMIDSTIKLSNKYPHKPWGFSIIIIIKLHSNGTSDMKNVEGMMKEMRGEVKEKMWEIKKIHEIESGRQGKMEGLVVIWHKSMGDMDGEWEIER